MKRSLNTQVSSVLRIVRGERDALVRTTHFKATVENVSNVTIERKIMSTKTTFKRVALVAVAAVGLGLLSAVPSNAATFTNGLGVFTTSTGTNTQVVGGQASVTVSFDTAATNTQSVTSNVGVSGVGSIVSVTAIAANGSATATGTYAAGATNWSDSVTTDSAGAAATQVITLTSAVVGTTTITVTPLDASGTPLAPSTKTITWVAALAAGVLDHSTAYMGSGSTEAGTGSYATPLTAAERTTSASFSPSTPVANVSIRQYSSAVDSTTALLALSGKAMTLAITGAGSVDSVAGGGTRGALATVPAGSVSNAMFYIFPDGRTGTATVTATVNGVTVGTWTYNFVGTATSIKMDPDATPVTYLGVGVAESLQILGYDVNGNLAATPATMVVTSGSPLIAAASVTAGGVVTVTGVAEGTSVITVSVGALATATITTTFSVTVTRTTTTVTTMAFDKASYLPGEKMTLTVSAKTSTATAVADGTRTVFSTAPSANVALQGLAAAFSTDLTAVLEGGVASYTMYAPLLAGDVVITAKDLSTTPVAITATATVAGGDAAAALEAANDAYDAANYAADAADAATTAAEEATAAAVAAGDAATAAQESADAALAAVTDLGLKVTGLISALRAQITSLTNLIVKIQKKVKA